MVSRVGFLWENEVLHCVISADFFLSVEKMILRADTNEIIRGSKSFIKNVATVYDIF